MIATDDPRHGKTSGYDAGCRETCCRSAAAAYEYRRRIDGILGRSYTVPSIGTARRIQGLVALGWTFRAIGEAIDRGHDFARKLAFQTDTYVRTTTADKVAEVYERMCMTHPPQETGRDKWRAQYAMTTAARNGWVVPLAWDCIDDPDERPSGMATATPIHRERTWASPDHKTCPRCGVVREVHAGRGRLCSDCREAA